MAPFRDLAAAWRSAQEQARANAVAELARSRFPNDWSHGARWARNVYMQFLVPNQIAPQSSDQIGAFVVGIWQRFAEPGLRQRLSASDGSAAPNIEAIEIGFEDEMIALLIGGPSFADKMLHGA
jgi:hypothetical protein